jgi:carboxypeptidase Taq
MPDTDTALMDWIRDVYRLEAVEWLLEWDQETMMPAAGVAGRAGSWAALAALKHERLASAELGRLLDHATEDGDPLRQVNLREIRRAHQRATRVPAALVRALTEASAKAKVAWAEARDASRFAVFKPHLERMVALKREEAEAIGYATEPYDALLDEYEPNATAGQVEQVFADLRPALVALVDALRDAPVQPEVSILHRDYPRAGQEQLARRLATSIGFDFNAGRLDASVHPFCVSMHPGDVRLTTRYDERFLSTAIFGTLHEAGHGLYEQGMDADHAFTPLGRAVSLGIHESQSRLWENQVGRSRPFWECHYAEAQRLFPASLGDVSLEAFYGAINHVAPSLIRVEADEVTYNLHIILRFEIERGLIAGRLAAGEVPDAWNAATQDLLGIEPPDDRSGCLQDIHWSLGVLGYFPTYTLGNLYAAQFFAAARRDLADLDVQMRAGDFRPLLDWLRRHIHTAGMRWPAGELCERVSGAPLSAAPFLEASRAKFGALYGLPEV